MRTRHVVILTIGQLAAFCYIGYLLATYHGPQDARRYVGVAMFFIGFIGIVTARRTLGRSFAITPQAKVLVTRGIYSKIRNPIYVSGAIGLAGIILALHVRGPIPWIILAILVSIQIIRARQEAKVLEAAFGDAYRDYRRKTWF